MSEWEDAEELEWSRFHGSVSEFIGETLSFERAGEAYELSCDGAVLGLLTRPTEAYLGETRDGSWEFSHPRRSIAHIDARNADDASLAAQYRRRILGSGGVVEGFGGTRYRFRWRKHPGGGKGWRLVKLDGSDLMTFARKSSYEVFLVTPVEETAITGELGLFALLCGYVLLLTDSGTFGGPYASPPPSF